MSEVLKLDIMGVMNQIHLNFKPTDIHGEALKFVLASDYDALAAQRDEGLAREAEAQRTIELYAKGEATLREENDALQQRLAEAGKLCVEPAAYRYREAPKKPYGNPNPWEIAELKLGEVFLERKSLAEQGTEGFDFYLTLEIEPLFCAAIASPGCADGEKAE